MNILEKIIYSLVSPSKLFQSSKKDKFRNSIPYFFLLSWISMSLMLMPIMQKSNIIDSTASLKIPVVLIMSSLATLAMSPLYFVYTFIVYLVTQIVDKKYEYLQSTIIVSYGLTPLFASLSLTSLLSYIENVANIVYVLYISGIIWTMTLLVKASKIIYNFTMKQSILTMLVAPIFGVVFFLGTIFLVVGLITKNVDLLKISYILVGSGIADYLTIVFLVKPQKGKKYK